MFKKGQASVSNDVLKVSATLKMEREVTQGDLIWIKRHGKSWWPALVVGESHVIAGKKPRKKSQGEVLVREYGTYEYLYVDPMKYYSEFKVILEQNSGSYREIFHKAVEQKVSRRKSTETTNEASESTGDDASKGKRKSNRNQVKEKQVDGSSPINANASECSKIIKANGANGKISKQNKLKRKLVSDEGEENARRNSLRLNRSNDGQMQKKQKTGNKGKQSKKKYNSRGAKEVVKQHMDQKKAPKSLSPDKRKHLKNTATKTPKQDKLLKEKSNNETSERSPGKSPQSSARRTRVMRGLGLMAPTGSPFEKNGLN